MDTLGAEIIDSKNQERTRKKRPSAKAQNYFKNLPSQRSTILIQNFAAGKQAMTRVRFSMKIS